MALEWQKPLLDECNFMAWNMVLPRLEGAVDSVG
jgi:hypothetical protein